ncbi:conserved exported hypothetical protein [Burkholderiales bacterium 8X]|nr:conserved exported hypothetical protein [Burkholderiales bacterium 8X]
MKKTIYRGILLAGCVMLAACSSPPTRYYSLAENVMADGAVQGAANATAPAAAAPAGLPAATAMLYVELAPVAMPERFARPQMVVRQKGSSGPEVDVLEQHRWASSFENELRDALSSGVAARLGAVDATRAPRPRGQSALRISVQMLQFDASPGRSVDAVFSWTLRRLDDEAGASCRVALTEPVGGDVDAIAAGARRVTSRLSDAIAASARTLQAGRGGASCSAMALNAP